jgi:GNAT superfamily N-acetyltransferase
MNIKIRKVKDEDVKYALLLSQMYKESAQARKTGIALRSPDYIIAKIEKKDAIIALEGEKLIGFCYIETFTGGEYVSNSGLIVDPSYRGQGLAKNIKKEVLALAREKYPKAVVFGITTSPVVMNINFGLGYKPVPFSKLTNDDQFWNGCKTCVNYDVLTRNEKELCLCTGMLAASGEEIKNGKNKQAPSKMERLKKLFTRKEKV